MAPIEQYLRCPYCDYPVEGHGHRVPKTIGRYQVKILNKILIFKCRRCAKTFKMEANPVIIMWERMKKKEREIFNKKYKGGKKTK